MDRWQKTAILMLAFGEEVASSLLRGMDRQDVLKITQAMGRLGPVSQDKADAVVEEFFQIMAAGDGSLSGGPDKAAQLLGAAFRGERGASLTAEVTRGAGRLAGIERLGADRIALVLQREHPQVITAVLAHLPPRTCGAVLKLLPTARHGEVLERLARLEPIADDLLAEVEEVLHAELRRQEGQGTSRRGGAPAVAAMLSKRPAGEREKMLEQLAGRDPALAQEVRSLLLTFEDLARLSDRDWQRLLREVPADRWPLALKTASSALRECLARNLSARAGEQLLSDLADLPKAPRSQVEERQQEILAAAQTLADRGEIDLGSDETMI